MQQTTKFRITGRTPLLMNSYTGDQSAPKDFSKLSTEEAWTFAREHAYMNGHGPFIPAENLQQALNSGGKFCKGKGRGNLSRIVAASTTIQEAEILLTSPEPELFRKMRKNPSTGGKMLNYRIRIPTPWSAEFTLTWDDELLQRGQLLEVVQAAGIRVGLMDWRPEKRGPYGQFTPEVA